MTCYIGEEFIGKIHCHAIGASFYDLAHQRFMCHAPGTHSKTLSMQALDDLWRHQRRAWTELGASQCMRLHDHGLADLSHQPTGGQLGSIGPHRLQMRVLERGEGDVRRHAMSPHQVYRPLGQVRRMPFEFDMEVCASMIACQHIDKRGDTGSRESFPKPRTGVKR